MKVVVFIGGISAPLVYFANKIHSQQAITLLVVENSKKKKEKPIKYDDSRNIGFIEKMINYLKFRIDLKTYARKERLRQKETENYQSEIFEGLHNRLDTKIPTILVDNINSKEVEEQLKEIKPNLIIDHGTSLVKDHIIDLSSLALNLHWGLSPYYRGVMCSNQALINWDINNIGVTIHKLAKKIDGGDILGQSRIKIEPTDSIAKITSRLTLHGTNIIINILKVLENGGELVFYKQDFTKGFLIKGKTWNPHLNSFINDLNKKTLSNMIQKPSRDKVPIIEFSTHNKT